MHGHGGSYVGFRRALEAALYFKEEMNGRTIGGKGGGKVDDGMLLMGFSGDTGKDNSTQ